MVTINMYVYYYIALFIIVYIYVLVCVTNFPPLLAYRSLPV